MEEDKHRLKGEVAGMAVERMSLLLELEAFRDVSSLHSQAGKDKEAMVEGYQKALEKIFFLCLWMLCIQTQHMR